MAFPTILGLFALSISVITHGFAQHASEVSIVPGENESVIAPDENESFIFPGANYLPTGSITEISYSGKVIVKKFTCPAFYGYYPHSESCEYYFECRFGYPTLWHCNRGYLYDREKQQCQDKRRVQCHIGRERDHYHHRDGKDKEIDVKEDVSDFKCPYIFGKFAHPYDCSKYYVCIHNHPKLFQCYQNFLYDTHIRKCLPSRRVKCGDRLDRDQMRTSRRPTTLTTTIKPVELTTVTPKNSKFYCPFPYGRYPDPEDCSRYYECRFSIPHLYICPESTLYDERKKQCIEKKRVKCGGRPGGNDEDPYSGKTTSSPIYSTLTPSTVKKVPETTTTQKPVELTTTTISTTTVAPSTTTISTTTVAPSTTATPVPTTRTTPTTTTTTTSVPTTTTTTTTTTTPLPTTTTTSTPLPTTTTTTTTSTPVPTTRTASTTTSVPQTTTVSSEATTIEEFPTIIPVTKPNTPPPTDCDENDLDCIIDDTGDVSGWFDCPKRFGHFPHGSSQRLFIHCDNWRPLVKKCAEHTRFSLIYNVCTREE